MAEEADAFHSCVDKLRKAFREYDQTVDIVSCWESFLKYSFPDSLVHFDRYPEDPDTGLTPDFTANFGDYGIVGEVKRTFPQSEEGLETEMEQVLKYDQPLAFRRGPDDKRNVPSNQDTLLLLFDPGAAFQITDRITSYLKEDGPELEGNLNVVDASYDSTSVKSRYVFRLIPGQGAAFQDGCLPAEKSLQTRLIDERNAVEVYPKHFVEIKAREVLCNDEPPPLYMAVHLWTHVFYELLTEEQKEIWRLQNPQKTMEIEVTPESLTETLNKDFLEAEAVRTTWTRSALEFLSSAGLATKNEESYSVEYRYITQLYGHRQHHQEGKDELKVQKECGRALADFYCKENLGVGDDAIPGPDGEQKGYQQKLGELKE